MNFFYYLIFLIPFLSTYDISLSNSNYSISSDTLLSPKAQHREQSKLIYQLLSKYHYKKVNIDDSLSEKILEKYINS